MFPGRSLKICHTTWDTYLMLNVICRQNIWYFNRRIPIQFQEFDTRKAIRFSLKTSCKKEAIQLAALENTKLQDYWRNLTVTGTTNTHERYASAVKRAEILGFPYFDKLQLLTGEIEDLIKRLAFVVDQKININQAESVLGMVEQQQVLLSELLPIFWDLKKEIKLDKSDRQLKKWKNPRILAMSNFLKAVPDKPVQKLDRQDMMDFKDWWIDRIDAEKLSKVTANKQIVHVKNIIQTVSKHAKVKLDREYLFEDIFFKGKNYKERLPFTTEHINGVLLKDDKLKGLSDHYRKMIWVFAESGVHIDEQIAIRPENIFLDHAIPHVVITSHEKDKLKTEHRERVMPLVGFALDAFRAYPRGFSEIVDDPDRASSAIGKYLRENEMIPSERHSLYSLRHSFQDRLTNADCPDRIQTDLMGHAFAGRIKYGIGASLEHSYTWLKRIQLKPT